MTASKRVKVFIPRSCWGKLVVLRLYEAYPGPVAVGEMAGGFDRRWRHLLFQHVRLLAERGLAVKVGRGLYALSEWYKRDLDGLAERLGGRDKLLEYLQLCVDPNRGAAALTPAKVLRAGLVSTGLVRVEFAGREGTPRIDYCGVCNTLWPGGFTVSLAGLSGAKSRSIRNRVTIAMVSAAVDRLARELGRLYSGARVGAVSRAEILAMVYLAAASANVNPVHVRTVFPAGTVYHIDHVLEGFARAKVGLANAFTPLLQAVNRLAEAGILDSTQAIDPRGILSGGVELWRLLEVLHSLAGMTSEQFTPLAPAIMSLLIDSIKDHVEGGVAAVKESLAGVPGTLLEAIGKAGDPDVKRLAGILASLAEETYKLADYTGNLIRDLRDATLRMASQDGYTEARARILGRLREAINYTREAEERINQLASEGSKVIQQLKQKRILLDIDTVEEAKKLLETNTNTNNTS